MTVRWIWLALLILVAQAGCGPKALIVVLPNADGSVGAVTVDDGHDPVLLDHAYAAGAVTGGKVETKTATRQEVRETFGKALAAQPILPSHFQLYFISDSDVLTSESELRYRRVFEDIKRRPVYQVEVVGLTDTVGDRAYNQELSAKRAAAIMERLVADGVSREAISIAGRGELDLAVPTGPQVSESRNRRVKITVR